MDDLTSLYRLLQEHHKLYCQVHGKWSVTVNYHMALHIPDLIIDHGPPQPFWCFSFERMNGALTKMPNSNIVIEIEVMNRHHTFSTASVPDIMLPRALNDILNEDEYPTVTSTGHYLWVSSLLNTVPDRRLSRQQILANVMLLIGQLSSFTHQKT